MTEKRKRSIPRIIKAFILLAAAAVLAYVGIFAYVCIRERSVPTDVPDADKYDAIIVLGAQVKRDGTPNVQLALRLDTAYDAYAQKNVPVVVCGAQGKDEPVPEAEAMKTYLMEKGFLQYKPESQKCRGPAERKTGNPKGADRYKRLSYSPRHGTGTGPWI